MRTRPDNTDGPWESAAPSTIRDGALVLEEVELARLAEELSPHGSAWVVGERAFTAALAVDRGPCTIWVSAIGPPELLALAARLGCWAAVRSSVELRLARGADFPGARLAALGAVLDDGLIKDALAEDVAVIQGGHPDDGAAIARIARALGHEVPPDTGYPALTELDIFAGVGGLLTQVLRPPPDLAVDAPWWLDRQGIVTVWPMRPGPPQDATIQGLPMPGVTDPPRARLVGHVQRGDWVWIPSPLAAAPEHGPVIHPPVPGVLVSEARWRVLEPRPPLTAES